MRSWRAFGFGPGQTLVLGATLLAHAGLGFVPLFGGPGYEAALALGLLLPLPLACLSAVRARAALAHTALSALDILSSAVRFALSVVAAQLVVLLLHGGRAGFCDPWQGLSLYALGPAAGAVMAAVWGTLAGLVSAVLSPSQRSQRGLVFAVTLAAAGPIGGILVSLWRFWTSPMVFAFDPFVGFFAGTLYDTVIDAVPRLITYRAGSAASLLVAVCACAATGRSGDGRLARPSLQERGGRLGLAAFAAALSLGITTFGHRLGHYQSSGTIRSALGHSWLSGRCEIVYASGILPERAELLGRECDAHVAAHEAYFETRFLDRITVFVFASAQQKGALMGASSTYIAKPWRHEVYIQSDNYPHPVLAHELAHVVAGSFGRGPLRVAGPMGGWIPDPGRIEGFAVAAAPPEDTDHTLLEWTKALKDLGLLPPLGTLFKLSFLGENSSTGYTVAGAVVDWLRTRHGPRALRAWYSGATIEEAFSGESLDRLQRAFEADLDRLALPERVRELARARFDRPAIFGRRCPHAVDERLQEAALAFEGFDFGAAEEAYGRALALDPSNFNARLGVAACVERSDGAVDGRARYDALAREGDLTRVQRASVLERLGDLEFMAREDELAEAHYASAEQDAFDEHRARTIAVKRHALRDPAGRTAIQALLIGDPRLGSDLPHAAAELGEWSATTPELGLADYLIGKNLYSRGRWRDAYERLERALRRDLPIASVRREALRTFVFAACAIGQWRAAEATLDEYLLDPGLSFARKTGMQRFARSCRPSAP
jgi:tetratricopeptide (TPR) repeat protein